MRDLMVLAAMAVVLPLALRHSLMAYLAWGWTTFVGINYYVYGFMASVPFNMLFALIGLAILLAGKDKEKGQITANPTVVLFVLFGVQASLAAAFAFPGLERNLELYTNLLKIIAFCFVMPMVLTNRIRLHAFVVAMVLGLAIHGVIDGLKTIVSAGGHRVVGLVKFGDNNHFAVILIMSMPLMIYLYKYLENKWFRWASLGALICTLAAVIGTSSRGAFVTLTILALWLISISKRKAAGFLSMAVLGLFMFMLAPDSWHQRMDTIGSAKQDDSFMHRVAAWKISSAIALDNPLFGGGFRALQALPVWNKYIASEGFLGFVETPPPSPKPLAAHSIYFEVMGDLGFVGFFIFIGILFNVFLTRNRIHKILLKGPVDQVAWAKDLSNMIATGVLGYAIGAGLLSLAYYEIFYVYAMMMEVLHQIVKAQYGQARHAT